FVYVLFLISLYLSIFSFCFFYAFRDRRDLHSFPTRRSSDLRRDLQPGLSGLADPLPARSGADDQDLGARRDQHARPGQALEVPGDRKSTRLNSSHVKISYAVFCLKKKITTYLCIQ